MTLAQKLKILFKDRKQNAIAERVGIHPMTLSSYICRGAVPASNVAVRLADALGVDAGWLIDERQKWPPVPSKFPTKFPSQNKEIAA